MDGCRRHRPRDGFKSPYPGQQVGRRYLFTFFEGGCLLVRVSLAGSFASFGAANDVRNYEITNSDTCDEVNRCFCVPFNFVHAPRTLFIRA